METSRRDILAAGTVLTALVATGACKKVEEQAPDDAPSGGSLPYDGPEKATRIYHVWADEDGVSHIRTVYAEGLPKPIPVTSVVATQLSEGTEDWHVVPAKSFVINTRGDIEAEVSDGSRQSIGQGDLVYLEDMTGKGHITRLLSGIAALFLQVDPEFDFENWLTEPSAIQGVFE